MELMLMCDLALFSVKEDWSPLYHSGPSCTDTIIQRKQHVFELWWAHTCIVRRLLASYVQTCLTFNVKPVCVYQVNELSFGARDRLVPLLTGCGSTKHLFMAASGCCQGCVSKHKGALVLPRELNGSGKKHQTTPNETGK